MRSAALVPLLLCAALPACASRPSSTPGPQAGAGGVGAADPIGSIVEVTPSAVHATLSNDTGTDLVFRTSVRVVSSADWKDAVPLLVGPDISVKAGTTSARWSIALPSLPDGYFQVMVRATPTREEFPETGMDGYLLVERGTAKVIEFMDWSNATNGGPVTLGTE